MTRRLLKTAALVVVVLILLCIGAVLWGWA